MSDPRKVRRVDRYELHDEIGRGGMGVVHFGVLPSGLGIRKVVAIKALSPELARDPAVRTQLLDEARLVSRIVHASVVPILEVVEERDRTHLVFEYVAGERLDRLVDRARRRGTKVPTSIVVAIVSSILRGLHAAHEATSVDGAPLSLVHRDVSPQNVLVGVDGVARILDFGIAKAAARSTVTREGRVKGKLPYMAPEQVLGEALDRRTDLWATSVLLYELATFRRPFDHADLEPAEIERQILDRTLVVPSVEGGDPCLDAIILRGLASDPEDRPATALEMATALEARATAASPSEVAAWLHDLAAPDLAERATIVRALEHPRGAASRRAFVARASAAIAALAIGTVALVVAARRPAEPAVVEGHAVAMPPVASSEPEIRKGIVAAASSESPALAVASSPSVEPPRKKIVAAVVARPQASAPSRIEPAPARTEPERRGPALDKPAEACDPPYVVDDAGRRRFKRECL
jgi:serine/threonine-protein kinase